MSVRKDSHLLKRFTIENFKAFQKCTIDLAPLTILIGENSSGKSSLLQALLLLKQTWESPAAGEILNLNSHYVQFHQFREIIFGMPQGKATLAFRMELGNASLSLQVGYKTRGNQLELLALSYNDKPLNIKRYPKNWPVFGYNSQIYRQFGKLFQGIGYLQPVRPLPKRYYDLRGTKPSWIGIQAEHLADFLETHPTVKKKVRDWFVKSAKIAKQVKITGDQERGQTEILMKEIATGLTIDISQLGFGYSQILPLVAATFTNMKMLIFEAPEIHLNPSLHGVLTDLFIDAANQGKQILVETHSEHVIYRIQRRIAEGQIAPEEVAIYYVRRSKDGSFIKRLQVTDEGDIPTWPKGFFDTKMQDIFERILAQKG